MPPEFDHVLRRFPELHGKIADLIAADPEFRGICGDYQSLCADLLQIEVDDVASRSLAKELNRLRDELDVELSEMLKANVRPSITTTDRR